MPNESKSSDSKSNVSNEEIEGQFTLGFIFEWWCNIIVGIIIQRDCDDSFCDEVDNNMAEQEEDGLPMMAYYNAFGHSLSPPYLLPKPAPVPANVVITILNCENLVSRLKRPIHQQVCSFVTVSLGDQTQQTKTVMKSFNPVFTHHTDDGHEKRHQKPMVFEIPEELNNRRSTSVVNPEDSEYASLHITIEDKRSSWADRLGNIRIPLNSLKAVSSSGNATVMRIPFIQRRRHFGIRERTGMKSKESHVEVLSMSQMESMRINSDDTLDTSETASHFSTSPSSASFLNILISKEDINASWLMCEFQARDEARRSQYLDEKRRQQVDGKIEL
jgi:hypothetical protein